MPLAPLSSDEPERRANAPSYRFPPPPILLHQHFCRVPVVNNKISSDKNRRPCNDTISPFFSFSYFPFVSFQFIFSFQKTTSLLSLISPEYSSRFCWWWCCLVGRCGSSAVRGIWAGSISFVICSQFFLYR